MKVISWVINTFKQRSKKYTKVPHKIWRNPLYFIAFGFGSGAIPFAPGTFGTLIAIPFYLLIRPINIYFYLALVLIFIMISSIICDRVSREMKVHDHPGINIDEFVGFFVTMIYAPSSWIWIIIGFILFRVFDILKPWPIRWLDENIKGGFGIVFDDVIAGIYASLILQLLSWGQT